MLDLHKGAKEYEHFHLQSGPPVPTVTRCWWIYKLVTWSNLWLPDGTRGTFRSWWLIGNLLHWYAGDCKCDGTRTRAYWDGQLDDARGEPYIPNPTMYVMTTTGKEKTSVRFLVDPGDPTWDGMGGS